MRHRIVPLLIAALTVAAGVLAFSGSAAAMDPGETIWTRFWGADLNEQLLQCRPCPDGDMIVVGHVSLSGGIQHIIVGRYAPSGKRRWMKTVDVSTTFRDVVTGLAVDDAGNAVVSAGRLVEGTNYDVLVVKFKRSGAKAWQKQLDGGVLGNDWSFAVAVDDAGNAYVPCRMTASSGGLGRLYKLRARNGSTAWARDFTGERTLTLPQAIDTDGRGNSYVTGEGTVGTTDEMITVKLSPSGQVRWTAEAPGSGTDQTEGDMVAVAPNGALYVAGSSGVGPVSDVLMARYTTAGALKWQDKWDASGAGGDADRLTGLVVDRFGNAFVSGYVTHFGPAASHGFVARWRPNMTRWTYANPHSETDTTFRAVSPDNAGGCYIAGRFIFNFHDIGHEVEIGHVARFASSGTIKWDRAYACVARRASFAGMAVWPGKGVCLVGSTVNTDGTDYQTLVQLRKK